MPVGVHPLGASSELADESRRAFFAGLGVVDGSRTRLGIADGETWLDFFATARSDK